MPSVKLRPSGKVRRTKTVLEISKPVASAFEDFVFNWDYEQYLLVGGYGSGKSYSVAVKLILKLLQEKRKCMVVRQVFSTIQDSCYSLICEVLDSMGLLTSDRSQFGPKKSKVLATKSSMGFQFPNGSKVIFKGMDKPEKVKSVNGVSIVWVEEASEVKFNAYEELLGRLRTPDRSMHFILSCNPVSKNNWIYRHFFASLDEHGIEHPIVNEAKFYSSGVLVRDGVYYHHSTSSDNPWLPPKYLARLNRIKEYDVDLYMVARWGQFGADGVRVLPQARVVKPGTPERHLKKRIERLGYQNMYFGFDFGFEESFNAVLSMSVDPEDQLLIVWDEVYMNHVTDPDFAALPEMQEVKERILRCRRAGADKLLVCDSAEPKAIKYYKQMGFPVRAASKHAGSRLENTRKVKRFRRVYIMPNCVNTIRELRDLTYATAKNGDTIHDQFNIDSHSFSAIWYALDRVTVADLKDRKYYSKKGS